MATARYQQQVAALFEFLKTVATEVGSSVGVGLIEKVPANSRFLHFFGLSVPSVAASDDEQADIFFYDPKGHGGVGAKYVVNGSAFAVNRTDQTRAVQALLDTWHQLQANKLPAYFRSAEGHNVAMTNAHLAPPESVQTLLTERRRVHEVSSWRFRRLLLRAQNLRRHRAQTSLLCSYGTGLHLFVPSVNNFCVHFKHARRRFSASSIRTHDPNGQCRCSSRSTLSQMRCPAFVFADYPRCSTGLQRIIHSLFRRIPPIRNSFWQSQNKAGSISATPLIPVRISACPWHNFSVRVRHFLSQCVEICVEFTKSSGQIK